MKLKNVAVIETPYDSKIYHDPSWRSRLAVFWKDNPDWRPVLYPELCYDDDLHHYVEFLTSYRGCSSIREVPDIYKPYYNAHLWNAQDGAMSIKANLEALLLTGASYDIIAADMSDFGEDPKHFSVYERLFFNTRTDEGTLNDNLYMRTRVGFPQGFRIDRRTPEAIFWKAVATQVGYRGLTFMWHWDKAHGTRADDQFVRDESMRIAQAYMLNNLLRNRMDTVDLNTYLGQYVNHERMERETGQTSQGSETKAYMTSIGGILRRLQPSIESGASEISGDAAIAEKTKALQARIMSQKNITDQSIPDAGAEAGLEAVSESMHKLFESK